MQIIVKNRQTIADIAVSTYGSLMGVIDLVIANELSLTDDLKAGQMLKCPDIVFDKKLQEYLKSRPIEPATAVGSCEGIQSRIFTDEFNNVFK